MRSEERITARRVLDSKLNSLRNSGVPSPPPRGWIRAIREALGMTSSQLAERLGVVQSRVPALEQAEAKKTATLASLEKAAQALDCRLVYALIPREPLDDIVAERAWLKAKQQLAPVSHSMALEAQNVAGSDELEQLKRLARQLAEKSGSELWKDSE